MMTDKTLRYTVTINNRNLVVRIQDTVDVIQSRRTSRHDIDFMAIVDHHIAELIPRFRIESISLVIVECDLQFTAPATSAQYFWSFLCVC